MALSTAADLAAINPLQRETLQERVYRQLKVSLMGGKFPPGRSMTIRALAGALGTSPMPVREALRQLVAERALEMLPSRSFGIELMTPERFADLLRIRVEIEGFAAAEAASRIEPNRIERLASINDEMSVASKNADREAYIALNQQFHFGIYETAGSNVLLPMLESLWLQIGPYLNFVFDHGRQPDVSLDHHFDALEGLRARDARLARSAIVADISGAADVILSKVKLAKN